MYRHRATSDDFPEKTLDLLTVCRTEKSTSPYLIWDAGGLIILIPSEGNSFVESKSFTDPEIKGQRMTDVLSKQINKSVTHYCLNEKWKTVYFDAQSCIYPGPKHSVYNPDDYTFYVADSLEDASRVANIEYSELSQVEEENFISHCIIPEGPVTHSTLMSVDESAYFLRLSQPYVLDGVAALTKKSPAVFSADFKVDVSEILPDWRLPSKVPNFLLEFLAWRQLFSAFSRIKSVIGRISAGYLSWQYGWKLMIADIKLFFSAATTFCEDFEKYKQDFASPRRTHYSDKPLKSNKGYSMTLPTPFFSGDCKLELTSETVVLKTISALIKTERPVRTEEFQLKLEFFLERFGFTSWLEIIWDAIPFSFVIDWFADISGLLEAMYQSANQNTKILDLCGSEKTTVTTKGYFSSELCSKQKVFEVIYERYQRAPLSPRKHIAYVPSLKEGSGLSNHRLTISAALIAQILKL